MPASLLWADWLEWAHLLHLNPLLHPINELFFFSKLKTNLLFEKIIMINARYLQTERSSNTNNNFFPRIIYGYEKRRYANIDVKRRIHYFHVVFFNLLFECDVITLTTIIFYYRGGIIIGRPTTAGKTRTPEEWTEKKTIRKPFKWQPLRWKV